MKLNEMRQVLSLEQIQLTKSLGQNFLHDSHQLDRIVSAGELGGNDQVLEIGPGLGPLTERLLPKASHILGIEKDERLASVLRQRFSQQRKLELVLADALVYLRSQPRDWTAWKLVSNLPYSVASPILVDLALSPAPPERLVVTLQLEVARRLLAQANSDEYGVLTLLVQSAYEPRGWFKIPSDCFFPAPNVDSACLTLVRRPNALLPSDQKRTFARIVKRAFSQRRKMMLKLLKSDWPIELLQEAFSALNISEQERAEKVRLDQFVQLTNLLSKRGDSNRPKP